MKVKSLSDIYASLGTDAKTIFVVPQIRFEQPETDYLYLLYKSLIDSKNYTIKSTSFLSHYKFVLHTLFQRKTILHYHWLEFQDLKSLFGMPWKLLWILLFKAFGGKLVWTIHNLQPHDQKWLGAHHKIHKWMANLADKIHIHCENTSEIVQKKFNISTEKIFILPHPTYPSVDIDKIRSLKVLDEKFDINLDQDKPVLLIFGNISTYKRIENILDLVDEEVIPIQTIIAGPVKKGQGILGKRLSLRAGTNTDIHLHQKYVEDNDIPFFFGAADFCFFNYDKILTSGSVLLAHSYHKKIIAPDLGCISDLKNEKNVFLFSSDREKRVMLSSVISTLNHE